MDAGINSAANHSIALGKGVDPTVRLLGLGVNRALSSIMATQARLRSDDEISMPLVQKRVSRRPVTFEQPLPEDVDVDVDDNFATATLPADRLTPSVAGGIVGFFGGLAGFAVVHGIASDAMLPALSRAAEVRGVDTQIAFVVAYMTAASVGALVGATFAVVTRYLRKWVPLVIWALVFFVSLATLLLATANSPALSALSAPILAAAAIFGMIVSFSLPLRRRAAVAS